MKLLKLLFLISAILLLYGCEKESNPTISNPENIFYFYLLEGNQHQDMNALYPCKIISENEIGIKVNHDYRLQKVVFKYGEIEYIVDSGLNEYLYSKDFGIFVGLYCDQENYAVVKAYHEGIGMMERARWDLGHIMINKPLSVKVFLTYN
ncbi:MAG: hypothetical protein WC358_07025 [Ignavibacteria bacterium]|jgi:hypothetical protein